jgi:hypothetical protein
MVEITYSLLFHSPHSHQTTNIIIIIIIIIIKKTDRN